MKLAEALILRADYQKRVEFLKERLFASAKTQDGTEPPENPAKLMAELDKTIDALESLIKKINRTNVQTGFEPGANLSDALAARDMLLLKRNAYYKLAGAATITQNHYSRSEIRFVSTVNVAEVQSTVDDLARKYRVLDSKIQAANWQVELSE